jgi:hypothetical protein
VKHPQVKEVNQVKHSLVQEVQQVVDNQVQVKERETQVDQNGIVYGPFSDSKR